MVNTNPLQASNSEKKMLFIHHSTGGNLIKEGNFIIIKRHQISSYLDNKEIVFKGKCRDIDFLRLILEAVI